jgi:putative membrane protein
MYKPIVIAAGVIIALSAIGGGAAAAKLTDPQIAHIVYTADNLDIENAKQALALAKKLNITPEDSPTSKSLKHAQDADRKKRDSLSDAAFDKAYADNEVAYHKAVDDALSKTLIPDAQNADLKSLLETGLKLFQDHERDAEKVAKQLKAAP